MEVEHVFSRRILLLLVVSFCLFPLLTSSQEQGSVSVDFRQALPFLDTHFDFCFGATCLDPLPVKDSLDQKPVSTDMKPILVPKKSPRYTLDYAVSSKWFTLNPDIKFLHAPQLPSQGEHGEAKSSEGIENYTKYLFAALVTYAHQLISQSIGYYCPKDEDCDRNQNYTYFSFLVTALSVPHHESRLNHLRQAKGSDCNQGVNEFRNFRGRVRKHLMREYRDYYAGTGIIFPDCEPLQNTPKVTQIMVSSDRSDFGLMQLNGFYHPHTVKPNIYLNIKESIKYGLEYVYDGRGETTGGFVYLRDNHRRLCPFNTNPYSDHPGTSATIFYDLARASWDFYNQGNVERACRFRRKHSFSENFKMSIDALVKFDNSIFHQHLPDGSLERAALEEIVHNFRTIFSVNHDKMYYNNLDKLIANYRQIDEGVSYPEGRQMDPKFVTVRDKDIVFRYEPTTVEGSICGYIDSNTKMHLDFPKDSHGYDTVIVTRDQDDYNQLWAKVQFPKFFTHIDLKTHDKTVEAKRKGVRINVRADATTRSEVLTKLTKGSAKADITGKYIRKKLIQGVYWYQIETTNGKRGWVHSNVVAVKRVPKVQTNTGPCTRDDFYINIKDVIFTDSVEIEQGIKVLAYVEGTERKRLIGENVRNRPAGAVVGFLPNNHPMKVLEVERTRGNNKWYKIRSLEEGNTDIVEGWMWGPSVRFIKISEGS